MSVLIKNKDIPKGCEQCWFNGHTKCRIMPIGFDEYPLVGRRPDWCPLVEVKEPHGRLIDADELANKTFYNPISAPYITYRTFCNAPTVIEAERREE